MEIEIIKKNKEYKRHIYNVTSFNIEDFNDFYELTVTQRFDDIFYINIFEFEELPLINIKKGWNYDEIKRKI